MNFKALLDRLNFASIRMTIPDSVGPEFQSYVGQEIPLKVDDRRSIVWLTEQEAAQFGIEMGSGEELLEPGDEETTNSATHLACANFRYQEKYWVALVRLAGVQNVLAQQEVFMRSPIFKKPLAAHGQLRFLIKDEMPILLFPQEQPENHGQPALEIDDLIVSAEAVPPMIENFPDYSLIGGAKGWYRQSMRFVATIDKASAIVKRGHPVNQFLLALKDDEPTRVFIESVRRAHEIGMGLAYNTLAIGGTHCVFEMFNILDRSVVDTRKAKPLTSHIWRYFDRMPLFIGRYLKRRGLRFAEAKNNYFPTLEEELNLSGEEKVKLEKRLELLANVNQ